VFAGGELDHYLRTLQNVGAAGSYPWSIRGFSPLEVRDLGVGERHHPWAGRFTTAPAGEGRLEYGLLRPRGTMTYNSAFPYGRNSGPAWEGRGVTTTVRLGGYVRYGPLSLVVAPVGFRAENRDFELAPAAAGRRGAFRSPVNPHQIDLPQRFGADTYSRVDPGFSTLRLDGAGVTAGVSTAAQQWGPGQVHPMVLGANAGGFSHAFVGTRRPVNVGIGRFHARYMAGRLEQSEYSPLTGDRARRVGSGFALVFQPRGLEGLEVGTTRFLHRFWPEDGLKRDDILGALQTFRKRKIPDADRFPDSQFASVFARWNFPDAGFEFFGEYVRVDNSWTFRTFLLEPDDQAGYALGLRRVWEGEDGTLTAFRGEVLTSGSGHRERGGARVAEAFRARPIYHHHQILQGHTHRGQLLATPVGLNGTGSIMGLDRYGPDGRWTVEWERLVIRDRSLRAPTSDAPDADVMFVLGAEVVRFRGPVDLEAGVRAVYNKNRNLQEDAFNLSLRVGATVVVR